ncbi:DNA topoisomerase 3-alpha [Diorhabda sublineata]|uniref:DNA topoisomerase 3-alpha n=1 Tax=Diorhabda sublineata TaxID=1163346 RepID=UPI0024E0F66F|nr:DNA topoisomerase 3-alpha [Diorhabda sublineata]
MFLLRKVKHVKITFNLKCCSTKVEQFTMKYLNVAEKNDAAKNIAQLLSQGNSTRREGLSQYNKIYEFNCTVLGEQVRMVMTSVSGHLLNYAFTGLYKNWLSCNPVSLFDAPITKVCTENYQNIKKTLEREIRFCDGLIIWTDCDREGENIGFEIIKVCTDVKPNIRIYRAKFSEITAASIQRALRTLGQPNKNISDAVDVRQELDLRTGAAFTRLQTLRLQKVFPQKLSDKLISYGSCQFPTLGFVVERYQAIENFIAEPFWRIKMSHTIQELTTEFNWKQDRLFDKNSCEAILDICRDNPQGKVESVESKEKSKWRPLPLDTVEMEKNVSRKLRINAKDTMQIAERLYSQGYISYPRTETNIFPKELNLVNLVEQQFNDDDWGGFARRIMNEGGPNPRQGRKSDQAHPPIHPIKYTNGLGGNDKRLYEYIVRHFLACLHRDAKGFETTVVVDVAEEKFTAKGLIVLEKNYLDVYVYEKWNAKEINNYRVGDTFLPTLLDMVESSTTPPKLLTEADLIGLMEKHGIGTDATHAEHIDKIKSREYVGLHENMYFVPGTLGMGLVEGYNNVGLEVSLAKPTLRAEFENDLKLICNGLKNPDDVRRDQIAKYKALFQTVVQRMRLIDESLGNRLDDRPADVTDNDIVTDNDDFRPVLKCPKCGNDMIVRSKRNGPGQYIVCTNAPVCRHVIWFPGAVETIEVQDQHCSQCGPNYKKLKLKFKQNLFPGYPNPNTLCIGGCDMNVLETLDITLSSVIQRNTNNIRALNNENIPNNSRRNSDSGYQSTRRDTSNFSNQTTSNTTLDNIPGPSRSNDVEQGGGIVCSCSQEAVLLTVRKEGPNQGRQFYGCGTRTCQFFLWAPEDGGTATDNRSNPTSTGLSIVKCNCRLPAVTRTVSKPGPNVGRQFYCCSKPMGQGCGFFKWIDESGGDGGHSGGGDDGSGGGGGGSTSFVQRRKNNNSKNRQAPYKTETKGKRKCGICGEEGHTRLKCPNK